MKIQKVGSKNKTRSLNMYTEKISTKIEVLQK